MVPDAAGDHSSGAGAIYHRLGGSEGLVLIQPGGIQQMSVLSLPERRLIPRAVAGIALGHVLQNARLYTV